MSRIHRFVAVPLLLGSGLLAQVAPLPFVTRAETLDSGYLANDADTARVVFRGTVAHRDAEWLRLLFDRSNLPEGSTLRIAATADGAVQRFDGRSLADYGNGSAYFNGTELVVELIAGPRTRGNRVRVVASEVGQPILDPLSICGPTDDRVQSFDDRQGRLSVGCTGWMIGDDLALTAGHCVSGTNPQTMSFRVPLSSSTGSTRQPPPEDQYPFQPLQSLSAGVGSDWAVARVLPNSNHGQLPPQRYGQGYYALGTVPGSVSGQNIRITGYGSSSIPTLNLVQKTHVAALASTTSTALRYVTDTTGGNSGSPVIHENTGAAIGIHTHGGCSSSGGSNAGTRIDRSDLQTAIRDATRVPGAWRAFGSTCGTTGASLSVFGAVPNIGQSTTILGINLRPSQLATVVLGLSNTRWGQSNLPLALDSTGLIGCNLYVSFDAPHATSTDASGIVRLVVPIPDSRPLVGRRVFGQCVFGDPGANALDIALTNAVELTIGG